MSHRTAIDYISFVHRALVVMFVVVCLPVCLLRDGGLKFVCFDFAGY